jgi:hypothetical protein
VGGNLFDDFGLPRLPGVTCAGFWFWEVEAGDLEAVEEQTGSAGVDLVGGDALEDLADGVLDGGAVLGEREVEGGSAALAFGGVLDGFAGGVVVVAELFSAEAWAAAAGAVGEDVAALVAFWFGVFHVYFSLPTGGKSMQSLQNKRPESGLPGSGLLPLSVKCESPACRWACFFFLVLFYQGEGN